MSGLLVRRGALLGSAYARQYSAAAAALEGAQVTRLSNGLRVATENTGAQAATVGVYVQAGSRNETAENNGASNLIEHLVFKGSKGRNQAAFEEAAAGLGLTLSATAGREMTAFEGTVGAGHVTKALALLGEAVISPALDGSIMDAERDTIVAHMKDVDSSDMHAVVMDYLHQTAFQGTGLAFSPMGSSRNATGLSAQAVKDFVKANYTPDRIVVAVSGNVSHDDVVKAVEGAFGSLQGTSKALPEPVRFVGSDIRYRDDTMPYAHVALAVGAPGATHPDNVALSVASTVLGSWHKCESLANIRASPLAQQITKDHSGEMFSHFHLSYKDTGLWGTYFVADRFTVDDICHEIQSEWMRLCVSASNGEVARARNALKTRLSAAPSAATLGWQVLSYGRPVSAAEWAARIDAVDAKTMSNVLSKYLYDKCPAVAASGPVEALMDYNRLRSAMYWSRF